MEWAAGGIVSTSEDILKFILALKNGKLINRKSMQEMQRWAPADDMQMGLSLFRTNTNYAVTIGHGGNVLGYSACVWWYENINCAVAILTNVGSMHASPEANSASKIFKNSNVGKLARNYVSKIDYTYVNLSFKRAVSPLLALSSHWPLQMRFSITF